MSGLRSHSEWELGWGSMVTSPAPHLLDHTLPTMGGLPRPLSADTGEEDLEDGHLGGAASPPPRLPSLVSTCPLPSSRPLPRYPHLDLFPPFCHQPSLPHPNLLFQQLTLLTALMVDTGSRGVTPPQG